NLEENSLTDILYGRFKPYIGKSTLQIANMLEVTYHRTKSFNNILARGMLGLDTQSETGLENISEHNNASYKVKTIQFDSRGVNKESMSFPSFKFKDLVTQNWTDEDVAPEADLNILFSESTFLFVVFQLDELGNNI